MAFAAAILIAQFVRNEFSYDRWIPGYQQIYKITDVTQRPGQPPNPIVLVAKDSSNGLRCGDILGR